MSLLSLLEDRFRSFTDAFEEYKASVKAEVLPLTFETLRPNDRLERGNCFYTVIKKESHSPVNGGNFRQFITLSDDGYYEWWNSKSLVNFTRKEV